jgi:hypothetical protein
MTRMKLPRREVAAWGHHHRRFQSPVSAAVRVEIATPWIALAPAPNQIQSAFSSGAIKSGVRKFANARGNHVSRPRGSPIRGSYPERKPGLEAECSLRTRSPLLSRKSRANSGARLGTAAFCACSNSKPLS